MRSAFGSRVLPFILIATCIGLHIVLSNALLTRDPLVWVDEATITDLAVSVNTTGHMATHLFGSVEPSIRQHAFTYPPAYFTVLALWIRLFGSTIESVRFFSITIAAFTLLGSFALFHLITKSWKIALLGMFLLTLDMGFGRAARIARMESFIELWVIISLYLYFLAIQKRSLRLVLASGISAGIAGFSHPIGLAISAILMFSYLFVWKKLKLPKWGAVLLISPSIVLYLLWILSNYRYLNYFIIQLGAQYADKQNYGPYISQLFHEPLTAALAGIYIIILCFYFVVAKNRPRSETVVISLGIVVMTYAQFVGKVMWYFVYMQPFLLLPLLISLRELASKWRYAVYLTAFGLFLTSIFIYGSIFQSASSHPNAYHAFSSNITRLIPKGKHVLLSTLPDPYFDLVKQPSLRLYEFPTGPISIPDYERFMGDVDVIVVNFLPIEWLANYMELNKSSVVVVRQPDRGYETNVVFLLPKNFRKSTETPQL